MSSQLILVTGVTGFIAGHVVEQLLRAGYHVRGTARSAKVALLQKTNVPNLEYVAIDDVAVSDFTEALKGVDAVVHVASPLPGKASVEETMKTAIEGSLNVLRQAEKAGIKKFVVTSSFGSVLESSLKASFAGLNFTDSDWAPTTHEDVLANAEDPYYLYFASKVLAEKAVWDFAREHPNVDVATILPGLVFGPYAAIFPLPSNVSQLGTNSFPWALINGTAPPMAPPYIVDVRDVAKAHVLALGLGPVVQPESVGKKRFLINAGIYTWKQAAEYLKVVRPELNIQDLDKFADMLGPISTLDTSRARDVLKFGEYIDPQTTVVDVADALVTVSKTW